MKKQFVLWFVAIICTFAMVSSSYAADCPQNRKTKKAPASTASQSLTPGVELLSSGRQGHPVLLDPLPVGRSAGRNVDPDLDVVMVLDRLVVADLVANLLQKLELERHPDIRDHLEEI